MKGSIVYLDHSGWERMVVLRMIGILGLVALFASWTALLPVLGGYATFIFSALLLMATFNDFYWITRAYRGDSVRESRFIFYLSRIWRNHELELPMRLVNAALFMIAGLVLLMKL